MAGSVSGMARGSCSGGTRSSWPPSELNREAGRAMRITPAREKMEAKRFVEVKGSLREGIRLQAKVATMGARKVITVASERSR